MRVFFAKNRKEKMLILDKLNQLAKEFHKRKVVLPGKVPGYLLPSFLKEDSRRRGVKARLREKMKQRKKLESKREAVELKEGGVTKSGKNKKKKVIIYKFFNFYNANNQKTKTIDLDDPLASKKIKKTIKKKESPKMIRKKREIEKEKVLYMDEEENEDLGFEMDDYDFDGDIEDLEQDNQEFQELELEQSEQNIDPQIENLQEDNEIQEEVTNNQFSFDRGNIIF